MFVQTVVKTRKIHLHVTFRNNTRRHKCPFTCIHTYYSAGGSVTREIPNFSYMLLVYFIVLSL